jgi:hypothetical protein
MSSEWKRPNSEPDFKGQANSFISNLKMIQALLEKQLQAEIKNLQNSELELKKVQAQIERRKESKDG